MLGRFSRGEIEGTQFHNFGIEILGWILLGAFIFLPLSMIGGLVLCLAARLGPERMRKWLASVQKLKGSSVAFIGGAALGLVWTLLAGAPVTPSEF